MKSLKTLSILLAGAMAVASCEQAPKSDDAKTTDAKAVDTTKKSDAQELKLDLAASSVTWVGTKPTGKHNGTFNLKEGSISVKENQIAAGKFVIDIASLKVLDIPEKEEGNAKLAGHLKGADFFDAEKFPTATFEVTSVEAYKADTTKKVDEKDKEYVLANPTHTITGNLELKGVKKSVSFPAVVNVANGKVDAEAKFNINRKDWGMDYGTDEAKLKDKFIRPTVHVGFKISAAAAQ
ncbi:MAG: YceI family protein [Raineya sp.]|jgi:polyisoprenoid-binding protein YceI|nr:YceI family protein [Raineya sp.]